MEEATEPRAAIGARPSPPKQPPASGLPDGAPEGLEAAARGENLDGPGADGPTSEGDRAESEALEFLLGNPEPLEYDVQVQRDTPAGRKPLTFRIRQLDADTILGLEKQNRKGTGPFAELDDVRFNAALVTRATVYIEDEKGTQLEPSSGEFRGRNPDPAIAMEKRFQFQPGILDGVAGEIRRVSAYSPDRVEQASRAVVNAAGN